MVKLAVLLILVYLFMVELSVINLQVFLQAGADLELGASTSLMEASQEGHLELVRYLFEARADVNATTGTK
jgi:ankyrin repeat protein